MAWPPETCPRPSWFATFIKSGLPATGLERLRGGIIDKGQGVWEIPTMTGVTKLDQRRRGIFPSAFRPGDLMEEMESDDRSVRFRLIRRAEAPEVNPRKLGGRLYLPRSVDRSVIAAAVRAERDAR